MKHSSLPKLTSSHLSDFFKKWCISAGPFKPYSAKPTRSEVDDFYIARDGSKVLLRIMGVEQVFDFSDALGLPALGILTVTPRRGLDSDISINVGRALESLETPDLKRFKSVFGPPEMGYERVIFNNRSYEGINVVAPINRLPFGRKGHLSEKFFDDAYEIYAKPAFQALARASPLG